MLGSYLSDLLKNIIGLAVIYFSGSTNKPCFFFRSIYDEPRVNRDAMPTHTRARIQDIHSRMAVGQLDEFPDIYSDLVANNRKFVRECDAHVTERIFRDLAHLGRACISQEAVTLYKYSVKIPRPLRTSLS